KQFNLNSLRLNLGTSFGREITKQISYEWERCSGVELFEFSYGMTETFTGDTLMPPQSIKYGTFGQPNVETDIKIVSLNNREKELPVGEIGEITIKSPAVFKGYLNSPEKTKEVLKNGRFYTNDIGKIDNDGYLCFLDKKKEVIKSSGYSIFPTEVELILAKHKAVNQVVVVGIPDIDKGENVKAFIVLEKKFENKITPSDLINWSKQNMAAYKYPRSIEFCESLPQSNTGKILRNKLK